MVYLITNDYQSKHGLPVLTGNPKQVFSIILSKFADDHILVIDDYKRMKDVLEYLNLDYKAVLNDAGLQNDPYVMFEEESNRIITSDDFLKIKKVSAQSDLRDIIDKEVSNEYNEKGDQGATDEVSE